MIVSLREQEGRNAPFSPDVVKKNARLDKTMLELENYVTEPTRNALLLRRQLPQTPDWLLPAEREILRKIVSVLAPQIEGVSPEWIAANLSARIGFGSGDGWRFANLPSDRDALQFALGKLAQAPIDTARMERVRQGEPGWEFPSERWFADICSGIAEIVYSHPEAQKSIRCTGFADARGYPEVGQNSSNPWEQSELLPLSLRSSPPRDSAVYSTEDEVDAVVVGLGAGGAPLAAKLCEAGLKVVAVEAGRWWNPADWATDEAAQSELFWRDERLSGGEHPIAFGANNSGTGVGGSTLHWTAYCPPVRDFDFRLNSEFGVGRDWPFSLAELQPYLHEVWNFLGVSGPSPAPLPPLPRNSAAQLMAHACDRIGLPCTDAFNAALSTPDRKREDWRHPCTGRGFCQAGCTTGAKGSMDVTYIPLALKHGLEIRSGAFVTEILREGDRVTGVVYSTPEGEKRQRCRALFLCAGAIETPRLLLLNDLGNEEGQVGQNFLAHTGLQMWGTFADETKPWRGIPGGLLSEAMRRPRDADFAGGYLLQSIGVMPVTYAAQMARAPALFGDELKTRMAELPHVAGINICGETLPHPDNRLRLSNEKDARGLPKPLITFTRHENENRLYAHAENVMRNLWEAAGGKNLWTFPREAHTLGTTAMGTDPKQSVVTPEGRVHSLKNLFVCDNGTFPSATTVNPCLTQVALALRTAETFLKPGNLG